MLIIEYLLGLLQAGPRGFDFLIIGAHTDFWFALVCKRLGARECVFFSPIASVLRVSIYVLVGDLYPCSKRGGGVAMHVHMYMYILG